MLQSYKYLSDHLIELCYSNNGYRYVDLSEDFGRIVERPKRMGFTTVTHTGIVLGICRDTKEKIIIHNHPDIGYAHLIWLSDFAKNEIVTYQAGECVNPPHVVIEKGLSAVINKVRYRPATSNCQILTTGACNNNPKSPDVNWFIGAAAVTIGVLFCFK